MFKAALTLLPVLLVVNAFGDDPQVAFDVKSATVNCAAIGCAPAAETFLVDGTTLIQTVVTDGNTVKPTGFPAATGGEFTLTDGSATATWTDGRHSTLIIPANTAPTPGQLYTSYFVTHTTNTLGGTPTAITRIEPVVTSTTSLVPSDVPPPPPTDCTPQELKGWTDFTITKSGTKANPKTITINNPTSSPATLIVVDRDSKTDMYSVQVEGQDAVDTSKIQPDRTASCDTADECLQRKWSNGKYTIQPGTHKVTINRLGKDMNFPSWLASYKLQQVPQGC